MDNILAGRNKELMGPIEGCINSIIEAKAWILILSKSPDTALGGAECEA
jgi:hypothetical protein